MFDVRTFRQLLVSSFPYGFSNHDVAVLKLNVTLIAGLTFNLTFRDSRLASGDKEGPDTADDSQRQPRRLSGNRPIGRA